MSAALTSSIPVTSIPLTTTFTPSPSCLSDYYTFSSGELSLGPPQTSDCLPSGWKPTSQYFSPGLCPSGYTIACSTVVSIDTLTETQATCCPTSYICAPLGWPSQVCSRTFAGWGTPATIMVTSSANSITTIFPFVPQAYESANGYGAANAYGILIAFQSTTTTTQPPMTYPTSSLPLPISTSPTNSPAPSQPLTPGDKAGIGISVTLVILGLFACLAFFILRHRRLSNRQHLSELQAGQYKERPHELQEMRGEPELYGSNLVLANSGGGTQGFEVEAGVLYGGGERQVVELQGY
jgi:hypothetical protein